MEDVHDWEEKAFGSYISLQKDRLLAAALNLCPSPLSLCSNGFIPSHLTVLLLFFPILVYICTKDYLVSHDGNQRGDSLSKIKLLI